MTDAFGECLKEMKQPKFNCISLANVAILKCLPDPTKI